MQELGAEFEDGTLGAFTEGDVMNNVGRIWVEVHYHEARGGAGMTRMWLDELPAWLDKFWEAGASRMVEQIVVL